MGVGPAEGNTCLQRGNAPRRHLFSIVMRRVNVLAMLLLASRGVDASHETEPHNADEVAGAAWCSRATCETGIPATVRSNAIFFCEDKDAATFSVTNVDHIDVTVREPVGAAVTGVSLMDYDNPANGAQLMRLQYERYVSSSESSSTGWTSVDSDVDIEVFDYDQTWSYVAAQPEPLRVSLGRRANAEGRTIYHTIYYDVLMWDSTRIGAEPVRTGIACASDAAVRIRSRTRGLRSSTYNPSAAALTSCPAHSLLPT